MKKPIEFVDLQVRTIIIIWLDAEQRDEFNSIVESYSYQEVCECYLLSSATN